MRPSCESRRLCYAPLRTLALGTSALAWLAAASTAGHAAFSAAPDLDTWAGEAWTYGPFGPNTWAMGPETPEPPSVDLWATGGLPRGMRSAAKRPPCSHCKPLIQLCPEHGPSQLLVRLPAAVLTTAAVRPRLARRGTGAFGSRRPAVRPHSSRRGCRRGRSRRYPSLSDRASKLLAEASFALLF